MPQLPTGTVTFLFADIEGSTHLLQRLGDHYAGVLAHYQEILDSSAAQHGGRDWLIVNPLWEPRESTA